MNQPTHPLKIVLVVHHFLPNFKAGAGWRAHRTATWLQRHGYVVMIVCIESIRDTARSDLRCEYNNPWVETRLPQYLAEEKPNIFYFISEYFFGTGTLRAAGTVNDPISAEIVEQEV